MSQGNFGDQKFSDQSNRQHHQQQINHNRNLNKENQNIASLNQQKTRLLSCQKLFNNICCSPYHRIIKDYYIEKINNLRNNDSHITNLFLFNEMLRRHVLDEDDKKLLLMILTLKKKSLLFRIIDTLTAPIPPSKNFDLELLESRVRVLINLLESIIFNKDSITLFVSSSFSTKTKTKNCFNTIFLQVQKFKSQYKDFLKEISWADEVSLFSTDSSSPTESSSIHIFPVNSFYHSYNRNNSYSYHHHDSPFPSSSSPPSPPSTTTKFTRETFLKYHLKFLFSYLNNILKIFNNTNDDSECDCDGNGLQFVRVNLEIENFLKNLLKSIKKHNNTVGLRFYIKRLSCIPENIGILRFGERLWLEYIWMYTDFNLWTFSSTTSRTTSMMNYFSCSSRINKKKKNLLWFGILDLIDQELITTFSERKSTLTIIYYYLKESLNNTNGLSIKLKSSEILLKLSLKRSKLFKDLCILGCKHKISIDTFQNIEKFSRYRCPQCRHIIQDENCTTSTPFPPITKKSKSMCSSYYTNTYQEPLLVFDPPLENTTIMAPSIYTNNYNPNFYNNAVATDNTIVNHFDNRETITSNETDESQLIQDMFDKDLKRVCLFFKLPKRKHPAQENLYKSLSARNYSEALNWCTRLLKCYPNTYSIRCIRAFINLLSHKNYFSALLDIDIAIKLKPKRSQAFYLRGEIYRRLGTLRSSKDRHLNNNNYFNELALINHVKALEYSFDDPIILSIKGALLYMMGRYTEAIRDLNRSLDNYPHNIYALGYRGAICNKLGFNNRAIVDFNAALTLLKSHKNRRLENNSKSNQHDPNTC
ncbi:3394_t:CDS:2 [Entrophospora sp. SA101]|nr:3394_t:CDS:2 [Entrophospora sp. SA101]